MCRRVFPVAIDPVASLKISNLPYEEWWASLEHTRWAPWCHLIQQPLLLGSFTALSAIADWQVVRVVNKHVCHLSEWLVLWCQGYGQIGLFDSALLLWIKLLNPTVDLVHSRVFPEVFWFEQPLDPVILSELLPIVHLLKNIVHRDGYFATWFTHYAWVVVLSSKHAHRNHS